MIRVGLTGGIGSGKSTVAQILSTLGAAVYNSDARSKEILASSPRVIAAVTGLLGEKAYMDGLPDRAYIASRVFSDARLLESLNAILHPAVRDDFLNWAEVRRGYPYVVIESAILVESGFAEDVDRVVVVTAPQAVRIERTMRRDGVAKEEVLRRMEAQMPEAERLKHADYILYADERQLLVPQVLQLDKKLKSI